MRAASVILVLTLTSAVVRGNWEGGDLTCPLLRFEPNLAKICSAQHKCKITEVGWGIVCCGQEIGGSETPTSTQTNFIDAVRFVCGAGFV